MTGAKCLTHNLAKNRRRTKTKLLSNFIMMGTSPWTAIW